MKLLVNSVSNADRKLVYLKDYTFGSVLFFLVFVLFVPVIPGMPTIGLDPSWVLGINQAMAQGLVWGQDIIFSFGPYGSFFTKQFHPETYNIMVFSSIYFWIVFFIVTFLNFRESRWYVCIGLLYILVISLRYPLDSLLFFYPLMVGIYLFKVITLQRMDRSNQGRWSMLFIILFSPLGFLPLVKGSLMAACVAIIIFSAILLIRSGLRKSALLVSVTPVVSMLLFWMFSKQPLFALPLYFISMQPIISGYLIAMKLTGNFVEILLYIISSVILIWVVFFNTKASFFNRVVVSLMFSSIVFLAYKAGFIRHDPHSIISGLTIILTFLLVGTLNLKKGMPIVSIFTIIAFVYIYPTRSLYDISWEKFNNIKFISAVNLKSDLLQREFDKHIAKIKKINGIPILEGTTDIYSHDQSYLIASGNQWNPRPVFQSYKAYTPELLNINKNHLLGDSRADNILFSVQPIDKRLPSLEDGVSWPVLLSSYQPVSFVKNHLLLKSKNSEKKYTSKLVSVSIKDYLLHENIYLPDVEGLIFAKIKIKKTFLGDIANIIYKLPKVRIIITMKNGHHEKYVIIPSMTETEFLLSPLIKNTKEYSLLYAGVEYLSDQSVELFSIDTIGTSILWYDTIEVEFFSMESLNNPDYLQFL